MTALRVALLVEGTDQSSSSIADQDPLAQLWNDLLCGIAGVRAFDHVIGISKRNLVAMDPSIRALSGVGEPLDELLARKLKTLDFDAAVVAWDLHPRWNPNQPYCRWNETLDLYRGIARSTALESLWVESAEARLVELESRHVPSARPALTPLKPGVVQAICMDRMFESLLTDLGADVLKRALGVDGVRIPRWPNLVGSDSQPDRVMYAALEAIRALRPRPSVFARVRGSFMTHKHEWARLILRGVSVHPADGAVLASHPIVGRLSEVASSSS